MSDVIVSLVSKQTIPNVLFICEKRRPNSRYLFISTALMEADGKSTDIISACGLSENPDSYQILCVPEDDLSEIANELSVLPYNDEDRFVVNLTGGTKMMSVAAFNYFSRLNSEIFYIPIGKNEYLKVHPRVSNHNFTFSYKLNIHEYLKACGLSYHWEILKEDELRKAIRFFSRMRHKGFTMSASPEIVNAHFSNNPQDRVFYSGRWFEIFMFHLFKSSLGLSDNEIALNVKIKNDSSTILEDDNEFDIMFLHINQLYVLECKVYLSTKGVQKKVEAGLYKLASLRADFGLNTKAVYVSCSYLGSTDDKENILPSLLNRSKLLNIKQILHAPDFLISDFENFVIGKTVPPASKTST